MYISIDKKRIAEFIAVIVFVWYGFTIGWEGRILPWAEYYLNRILYMVSIIIMLNLGKQKRSVMSMILPFTMIGVVLFFNNANIARNNTIQAWSICACLLFFCVANNLNTWHVMLLKSLSFVGGFYAFASILSMIFPPFFYRVCIPFFRGYGYADTMISLYQSGYITGFTPHYSTNAMYLAVTFGAVISYAFIFKFSNKRINFLALTIFACVLFTGKRAHSIFLIAAVMIIYLLLHCNEPITRFGKIFIILVVATVIFVITAQFIPQLFNVVNRFLETSEAGNIEMGRDVLRGIALELWNSNPLFGIGWDSYKYLYRDMTGVLANVHCVYLQLLCEVGIIGALPFFVFFIISIVKAIFLLRKMILKNEEDSTKKIALIYSVFIQVFFLLYCFTGNPLYDFPTLFTYVIGCTMSEHYWLYERT